MLKKDIPLDQAVGLVRACQKLNCDTADQLFSVVERRCREANMPFKVTPAMQEAAWQVLTRFGDNKRKRDPRSIGSVEVRKAIEAALRAYKM